MTAVTKKEGGVLNSTPTFYFPGRVKGTLRDTYHVPGARGPSTERTSRPERYVVNVFPRSSLDPMFTGKDLDFRDKSPESHWVCRRFF